jgi:hypothetical protein
MKTKKIIYEEKEMIGRMKFINQSKYNPHDERREEKRKPSNVRCFEYNILTNITCD